MPPGFRDLTQTGLVLLDYWIPVDPRGSVAVQRGYTQYYAWGLLRPGVTLSAARADEKRILSGIVHRYPRLHDDWLGGTVSGALEVIVGPVRQMIWLMYAAAAVLLLIACANVINLTLVRAAARDRELVMRTALGASRGRIAVQLATEMSVLACAAGALGLALGSAALRAFDVVGSTLIPRWENVI